MSVRMSGRERALTHMGPGVHSTTTDGQLLAMMCDKVDFLASSNASLEERVRALERAFEAAVTDYVLWIEDGELMTTHLSKGRLVCEPLKEQIAAAKERGK